MFYNNGIFTVMKIHKTFIFHGSFGSPDSNWFPWLKGELEKNKQEAFCEQFPVDDSTDIHSAGEQQNYEAWKNYFQEYVLPQIEKADSVDMVGHSIASIFILEMIQEFDIKVRKAVFVAPFLELYLSGDLKIFDKVNETFYRDNLDFENIVANIERSIVIYSENDPYVPTLVAEDFADILGTQRLAMPNGGHLGGDLPVFPEVLEFLLRE